MNESKAILETNNVNQLEIVFMTLEDTCYKINIRQFVMNYYIPKKIHYQSIYLFLK